MDIQKLEMLLDLYEGNSLAEIAGRYNYTPSAISHMLKALESELGIRLFYRDRTTIEPTPEGKQIRPFFNRVMMEYREMMNEVDRISNKETGIIRIGAMTSVVVSWIPYIINSFKKNYTGVEFEIVQGNYQAVEQWLQQGIIDCAFNPKPSSEALESYLLCEDKYYVIFPENHPIGEMQNFKPECISDYPFIALDEGSEEPIKRYFTERNIKLNTVCRVVDDYAVCAMVEMGLGISVVPELFLYRVPYAIGSRVLDDSFSRPICISYKKTSVQSPITLAFIEHVKRLAEQYPDILEISRNRRLILDGDKTVKL